LDFRSQSRTKNPSPTPGVFSSPTPTPPKTSEFLQFRLRNPGYKYGNHIKKKLTAEATKHIHLQ